MAKINEVLVGAKFEYNIGTTLEPIWATTTLDVQDLEWLERDSNDFNSKHRRNPNDHACMRTVVFR